jgi:hypothetical protein
MSPPVKPGKSSALSLSIGMVLAQFPLRLLQFRVRVWIMWATFVFRSESCRTCQAFDSARPVS